MDTASDMSQPRRATGELAPTGKATHVRWRIMAIVMAIMAVTALNRLNLSIDGKYHAQNAAIWKAVLSAATELCRRTLNVRLTRYA